jgi:hypothetical protein
VNRLSDAPGVLHLIDTFYDRLIARGVTRAVAARDDALMGEQASAWDDGPARRAA